LDEFVLAGSRVGAVQKI